MPALRSRLSMLAFAVSLAALPGCKKRVPLIPSELERVQTQAGVQPLRVYTEKKLLMLYPPSNKNEAFAVDREIKESSDAEELKKIVTKNTAGLILKIEDRNGMPLIWVTFDASCNTTDCAYAFVQNEDGKYRLTSVPDREGFEDPKIYRSCIWKKRALAPGRMRSLNEPNDVLLVKKNNGKILTIVLTVKKVIDNRTKTRTEREGGIQ